MSRALKVMMVLSLVWSAGVAYAKNDRMGKNSDDTDFEACCNSDGNGPSAKCNDPEFMNKMASKVISQHQDENKEGKSGR